MTAPSGGENVGFVAVSSPPQAPPEAKARRGEIFFCDFTSQTPKKWGRTRRREPYPNPLIEPHPSASSHNSTRSIHHSQSCTN